MNDEPPDNPRPRHNAQGPNARNELGWAWRALVTALLLVAYWPALQAGWVWDDDAYVTQNWLVQAWEGLPRIWLAADTPQYYPLVFTTFWLEHKLWGLDPTGYHVVNVLLHLANSLLVWRIALVLRLPAAGFIAAVFALHPVHVESVAWITERKNVLSALFYLLAFLAYLRFDDTARWRWYAAAVALFVAAMLSKTVTVTLPVVLVLALVWRWKRKAREGNGAGGGGRVACPRRWRWGRPDPGPVISGVGMAPGVTSGPRGLVAWLPRCLVLRHALALVPMILAGAALGLTTAYLERYSVGAEGAEWSLPFLQRLLILAPSAFCFYASKIAWPHPLIFIYPRWEIAADDWLWWLPALLLLAALGLLIRAIRRFGWGPFLLVLFSGVTLFPALGFFNVYWFRFSYVADHFQYLGSLGFIGLYITAGVWLGKRVIPRRWYTPAGAVLGLALLIILTGVTHRQSRHYRDAPSLWRSSLAGNPDAWIAMIHLSAVELAEFRPEQAVALLHRAEKYPPAQGHVYLNFGNLAYRQGRYEDAVPFYERAIALRPTDIHAQRGLFQALTRLGRTDEAAQHLENALADSSLQRWWRPWVQSQLWVDLATLHLDQLRFAEVARCAERALALEPNRQGIRETYIGALLRLGRYATAVEQSRVLLRAKPGSAAAVALLAEALTGTGNYAAACAACEDGLRKSPGHADLLTALIWLLATCPDDAVRDAPRAVSLGAPLRGLTAPLPAKVADVLAAAAAATGDFPTAISLAEQAVAAARAEKDEQRAQGIEERLAGYRAGRAYRLTAP